MSQLKSARRLGGYALSNSKFLSTNEYDQLAMVLQRNLKHPDHHRDALLLSVAVHTGARAREVLNIKKSDFDELHGSLYITGIKGSRDRDIPLPKWLSLELRSYTRPLAPQDRLFPITYNRFRQIWLIYRPAEKNSIACAIPLRSAFTCEPTTFDCCRSHLDTSRFLIR